MSGRLPAYLICGFLGAGKTTLLNRALQSCDGGRVGVLVNDFGTLNIDAELIEVRSADRIALSNGCICCTIQDDLAAALVRIAGDAHRIERILVECSGLSHPSGVLPVFEGMFAKQRVRLNGVFCVIDASGFEALDFRDTELAIDQAALSDIVLINKADLVDAPTLERVQTILRDAQPDMRMVPTVQCDLPIPVLFGTVPASPSRRSARHGARPSVSHEEDFASISVRWAEPIAPALIRQLADAMPPEVLRAKAVFTTWQDDHAALRRAVYQRVGRRSTLDLLPHAGVTGSRLLLIGRKTCFDPLVAQNFLAGLCPGFECLSTPRLDSARRVFSASLGTGPFQREPRDTHDGLR